MAAVAYQLPQDCLHKKTDGVNAVANTFATSGTAVYLY